MHKISEPMATGNHRVEIKETSSQQGGFSPTDYALQNKGRGACSNLSGRFEKLSYQTCDDGWQSLEEGGQKKREVFTDHAKHILTRNSSPDIPFDRSINPYKGCEHGCIYCFARPTHAYMGFSPGLDFESKIFAKPNAVELLRKELSAKKYRVAPIAMGTNTDPYQPLEKQMEITRGILEVMLECRHPVTLVTKSRLIVRDLDILRALAEKGLVQVALSLTTLDPKLARTMEPRASTPQRRLDAIRLLSDAGIPTAVMFAPVIPALNDHEMETLLTAAKHVGACEAAYILLRLPREVVGLFEEWLDTYFPERKARVMNRLMAMKDGQKNDPRFGYRFKARGVEGSLMRSRMQKICNRLGLGMGRFTKLRTDLFIPPSGSSKQYSLLEFL